VKSGKRHEALCWHGKGDIRCDTVPDPKIEHPRDAIIKVTACAICGSDLHFFNGVIPEMKSGDVVGHETMGEVVEVGADNKKLKVGDRVVVPFTISCGECFFCKRGFFSGCERSNPDKQKAEKLWGHSPAGLFGYSHLLGGYSGGQAEYLRVPFADVGPVKVPDELSDEQVLFLSDIFPTGYMAAEFCNIQGGETIAVWGCGPVGQFAIRSAFMLGAERVIAIDTVPERLSLAKAAGAETLDFKNEDYLRGDPGQDARPGCRRLYRCRRHRARHDGELGLDGGPGGSGNLPDDRQAARPSASDPLLQKLRHGLHRRRLRRLSRLGADGFGDQSRPHLSHGTDAGPALFAEAAAAC